VNSYEKPDLKLEMRKHITVRSDDDDDGDGDDGSFTNKNVKLDQSGIDDGP
jgi:hypothetical protein